MQAVAPKAEKPPEAHSMQVASVTAAEAVEKLPAGHARHEVSETAPTMGE